MKKLFYAIILFTSLGFSQSKEFIFTPEGITDFLVIDVPGKTAAQLYSQTINWINTYYSNPESVIKGKIENDYIRFVGTSSDIIVLNSMGKSNYSGKYQIEVSFQDNKYKFDVISLDLLNTQSDPVMTMTDMSVYYKKDGKLKGIYKYYPDSFTSFFNDLNKKLFDYLSENSIKIKKDW